MWPKRTFEVVWTMVNKMERHKRCDAAVREESLNPARAEIDRFKRREIVDIQSAVDAGGTNDIKATLLHAQRLVAGEEE